MLALAKETTVVAKATLDDLFTEKSLQVVAKETFDLVLTPISDSIFWPILNSFSTLFSQIISISKTPSIHQLPEQI